MNNFPNVKQRILLIPGVAELYKAKYLTKAEEKVINLIEERKGFV